MVKPTLDLKWNHLDPLLKGLHQTGDINLTNSAFSIDGSFHYLFYVGEDSYKLELLNQNRDKDEDFWRRVKEGQGEVA